MEWKASGNVFLRRGRAHEGKPNKENGGLKRKVKKKMKQWKKGNNKHWEGKRGQSRGIGERETEQMSLG